MSFTQTDLDELNKAIASGASQVEIGDRKVTYRGLPMMLQIRDQIAASLGQQKSGPSTAVAEFKSGF